MHIKECEASFKEAGFDYIVTEKMVCAGGEKGERIKHIQPSQVLMDENNG